MSGPFLVTRRLHCTCWASREGRGVRCGCWMDPDGPCVHCEARALDAREEERAELAFIASSEPWSALDYLAFEYGPEGGRS